MSTDFSTVTELSGDDVTQEQVARLAHRYRWAGEYCRNKDVLEVACGPGQGLGYLASIARSLSGGDITPTLVSMAKEHYRDRVDVEVMNAERLPFPDVSLDVVILFEAIYYLPSPEKFVAECKRVLRPGGMVLIVTANKDLYDFNPSPFSQRYLGVVELGDLFGAHGFVCGFFGHMQVTEASLRQRALRPVKALVARSGLMPKTMAGKKFLKRLVFGSMIRMPAEIDPNGMDYQPPEALPLDQPDRRFKVIYLAARREA